MARSLFNGPGGPRTRIVEGQKGPSGQLASYTSRGFLALTLSLEPTGLGGSNVQHIF